MTEKSVWFDLCDTPEEAYVMEMRSQLLMNIEKFVKGCKSQAAAARILGITAPRLSDLLNGRLHRFSLEALITLTLRAGSKPSLKLRKAA